MALKSSQAGGRYRRGALSASEIGAAARPPISTPGRSRNVITIKNSMRSAKAAESDFQRAVAASSTPAVPPPGRPK